MKYPWLYFNKTESLTYLFVLHTLRRIECSRITQHFSFFQCFLLVKLFLCKRGLVFKGAVSPIFGVTMKSPQNIFFQWNR